MVQILVNSLLQGATLGLLAIGLTVTFSILRFANFAHGEFAMIGAYAAYVLSIVIGLPFIIAAGLGVAVAGGMALFADTMVFGRLRNASPIALIIASLGLSMVIRAIFGAAFGADEVGYELPLASHYRLFGAVITSRQVTIIGVAAASLVTFHLLLKRTKLGKSMRALSDDPSLARGRGLNVERIIKYTWFIGGCYAGLTGVLIGAESIVWPDLGYELLLPVFAATIIGGVGNVHGAVLGAMLLALVENLMLAINWSPLFQAFGFFADQDFVFVKTQYRSAFAFIVLVIVLIWRPTGILRQARPS